MALPRKTIAALKASVDRLFDRARAALLGVKTKPRMDKIIEVTTNPEHTITGLYEAAAQAAGADPSGNTKAAIGDVVGGHLEALRERAKAHVIREADAAVAEARAGQPVDPVALGERLAAVWQKITAGVMQVVDTEATQVRNLGVIEGVAKVAALRGEDDPVVYWVVTRRAPYPCDECKRLHLLPDGVTPRVWRMSEVGFGYHKHGDNRPCVGGLHPSCRCSQVGLSPGFGFSAAGSLEYKGPDWDEFAHQRATYPPP